MALDIVGEEGLGKRGIQWTEVLSSEPRASIFHNFLSKEECEYLINLAKPHMVKSKVRDQTGQPGYSSGRTSTGMFLRRGQDKVISHIEKRIADYTLIPVEHGEGLQIINYEVGQEYKPHHDGCDRMATLLMYLSDVEEGGETVFPKSKGNSCCLPGLTTKELSVKPKMGDALFFWTLKPDRVTLDPSSLHGSRPVIRGHKWACTKWMHPGEYKVI